MSRDTFLKALKMGYHRNITIGGGEPLLHPDFWELLIIAIASGSNARVVTNGLLDHGAITLAELARRGIIRAQLTLDKWHTPIKSSVVAAFKEGLTHFKSPLDGRRVKEYNFAVKAGRADFGIPGCCCDELTVLPDGEIYGCGCFKQHFGNVDNYSIPNWYQWGCTEKKET